MSGLSSERVDPFRLAGRGAVLSGALAVAEMPRLAALLAGPASEVAAELRFSRGAKGRSIVTGHLSGRLDLRCQRCLEPMPHDLDVDFEAILVESETDEAAVLEQGEPLLVVERSLSLVEMVEDEILLALPLAPLHGEGDRCRSAVPEFGPEDVREEKANPFAVLAGLRGGDEGK